jgi:dihydrofolate reductase
MIKIIFARSLNKVIGKNNSLPWNLTSELNIFKEKTLGHSVLMGRKTFESLPARFRPLPGRRNLVVTSDYNFNHPGVVVVNKPMEFLIGHFSMAFQKEVNQDEVVWVIGGLEIFSIAMQFASEIHVTEIRKDFDGDVYSPPIDLNKFYLANSSSMYTDSLTGIDFFIDIYKRR